MSIREEAAEYGDVIGVSITRFPGDPFTDATYVHLCIDDAERRGIGDGDDFSFLHIDPGRLPVACQDCGRILA